MTRIRTYGGYGFCLTHKRIKRVSDYDLRAEMYNPNSKFMRAVDYHVVFEYKKISGHYSIKKKWRTERGMKRQADLAIFGGMCSEREVRKKCLSFCLEEAKELRDIIL